MAQMVCALLDHSIKIPIVYCDRGGCLEEYSTTLIPPPTIMIDWIR